MAKSTSSKQDDEEVAEGRSSFETFQEAWAENAEVAKADLDFALLENQWDADVVKGRQEDGRPALTINKLKAFGKQVINDARQNKPSIKTHPVDSVADPEIAQIYDGVIRNIEYSSSADVAYDTAMEQAVWSGYGYWRIGLDYAYDDSFDMDITIDRIINQFSVYGDPNSTAADSSDWNEAFIVDRLTKKEFERQYPDAETADWDDDSWKDTGNWLSKDHVMVAERWTREKVDKPIVMLSDDTVVAKEDLTTNEDIMAQLEAGTLQVVTERTTKSCKVTQRIMSGLEILKRRDWPGRYIPIVPVYGDEFNIEGKRYFRSLIHSAKDSQRAFNYWRTNATEMVALAPRAPFIGPEGAFTGPGWKTANTRNHAYLEYDVKAVAAAGGQPPQRQALDMGAAAGSIQEALSASDDIKSVIGMYDASLGQKSNETSGKAIMARQREGDVATFHFIDNTTRAIRHTGRILIDLIPKVYNERRMLRVIGEDGKQETAKMKEPVPVLDSNGQPKQGPDGLPMTRINDLSRGKYDLVVKSGPSFTTRREEAAYQMTEALRSYPDGAPIIMPELAKNLDWPGADKIAEKLEAMQKPQIPPEVQQQIEEGAKRLQELEQENQQLKADTANEAAKIEMQRAANTDEMQFKEASKIAEMQMEERIAMAELAMKERIAERQAALDAKVAAFKAETTAKASVAAAALKPQPQGNANGQNGRSSQ